MGKEYFVTVWLDCEYCFTHKYSDDDILGLIWNNMPDDTYNEIREDFEVSKITEEQFIASSLVSYGPDSFRLDQSVLDRYEDCVPIKVGFTISQQALVEKHWLSDNEK